LVTCYEAGAFGFHLHRKFEQLGIKNYVVQPQDWDERGKRNTGDNRNTGDRHSGKTYCPCAATAASAVKLFKVVGKVRLKV
jgi:hypothetical protein